MSEQFSGIKQIIGRNGTYFFDITAPLGSGTFGRVYKAWKEVTPGKREYFAIKEVLFPDSLQQGRIMEICNQEINELQKINSHNSPYIVKLYEICYTHTNTAVYLIMEFCDGTDLRKYLKDKPDLNTDEIFFLFYQILEGMKVLHALKKVHRDIKPDNILVNKGILKISDFQFAKDQSVANTILIGTPLFMAPEMFSEQETNQDKVDIFSLGVLLYWLIFRKTPWEYNLGEKRSLNTFVVGKEIENQLNSEKPSLYFPADKNINQALKDLILSMITFHPDNRITWEELFKHKFEINKKNIRGGILRTNEKSAIDLSQQKITLFKNDPIEAPECHHAIEKEISKDLEKILIAIEKESYIYIFIYNVLQKIIYYKSRLKLALEIYYGLLIYLSKLSYIYSDHLLKVLKYSDNYLKFPKEEWNLFLGEKQNSPLYEPLLNRIQKDNMQNKLNLDKVVNTIKEEQSLKDNKDFNRFTFYPKFSKSAFLKFQDLLKEVLRSSNNVFLKLSVEADEDFKLLLLIEDLFMLVTFKSTFNWSELGDLNLASFYESRFNEKRALIYKRVGELFKELSSW